MLRRKSDEKIAHFLSCKTAVSLGPDMVSRGCSAFFGYDIDYSFPMRLL
jgi:hypothetical protein